MNYRALEDLIGILVKKAGYKLTDLKVEEDIDFLEERKKYLESEITSLKNRLDVDNYVDKEEKLKDEDEKTYLEETLKSLNNTLSELDNKLNDKNIKSSIKRKTMGEKALLVNEISRVTELLELANLKLQNKAYYDNSSKTKDMEQLNILESELKEVEASLEVKYKNPVILGNKLLDAFKENKSFESVSALFESLLRQARSEYERTSGEVKDTNIFELMDKYGGMKRAASTNLESNNYSSEEIRQSLFEKERYHNSRLDTFKSTLEGIDRRKEELKTLIDESKKLYDGINREINLKEDKLNSLVNILYNEVNLVEDEEEYKKQVNELRNEIVDDKYLENKYNSDIQSFKDEVKNLEINYSNINSEIAKEQKSLEIIHDKLNNKIMDNMSKFSDKVNYLVFSNRIEHLLNEQQYLYVNVDVIKDEVANLWNKGEACLSNKKQEEVKDDKEEVTSMYESEQSNPESNIEVIDYLE